MLGAQEEPQTEAGEERKDLWNLTERVVLAAGEGWMGKLRALDAGDADRFRCCFLEPERQVECYPSSAKRRKYASTLDCVSNLVYDVTVNNKKEQGDNDANGVE